jgi:hypothetical protein
VSADVPDLDLAEPADPALNGLIRALTADGTAAELAARPAALAMYRDSSRRPHRRRFAVSMSTAAAAVVLAGGVAAAYAAALPAPVQHIAYQMLGSIGVPDIHRAGPSSGSSSGPSHLAVTIPPASSARGSAPPRSSARASSAPASSAPASPGCPCPAGTPGSGVTATLVLTAAQAQIPADGDVVLSGRLAAGGRPEAGVRVRLYERPAGTSDWWEAASGVTDGSGDVTLTVPGLISNAAFRLADPKGAASAPVVITVTPAVVLDVTPGLLPGRDRLTVLAPFADPGDVVVLQERSGGAWHPVAAHVLGPDDRASFSVLIPAASDAEYRVVLPRTITHGRSVSGPVQIAG